MLRRFGIRTISFVVIVLIATSVSAERSPEHSSHASAQKTPPGKSRAPYIDFQVPAGTPLPIRLRTSLDSASSRLDDEVRGTLMEAVSQDGVELIPKGSTVHGKVTEVVPASRENRTGLIAFEFHVIEHIETHSLATIQTRRLPFEATLGPKEKFRDVRIAADERVIASLAAPLKVHIPRGR